MTFESTYHSYSSTGAFSQLVIDYLEGNDSLNPFYNHRPNWEGIDSALSQRRFDSETRKVLTEQLRLSYVDKTNVEVSLAQIRQLESEDTFTVCTAHQPNILTGPMYFIYKIIHCIVLAKGLNERHPDKHFVPVYYMGSEDADLQELGFINAEGVKLEWKTHQKGAVGRMMVDDAFQQLIQFCGEIWMSMPFGKEVKELVEKTYVKGKTISVATADLVHELFGRHGLLIFNPDNRAYKSLMMPVFESDLKDQMPFTILQETIKRFPANYKIQLSGRPINIFYLKDDLRARIEMKDGNYFVAGTEFTFTLEQLLDEMHQYPERFSPNAVLRPLMQEVCLPNVAFVGGGGELAYWLELKSVFEACNVQYPVLMLRNSFLVMNEKSAALMRQFGLHHEMLFNDEENLIKRYFYNQVGDALELGKQIASLKKVFQSISAAAAQSDVTLKAHVASLEHKAVSKIEALEKKMLRAEKRKQSETVKKIQELKNQLFPGGALQERHDNFLFWLASCGPELTDAIFNQSNSVDAAFCILELKP